LTLLEVFDDDMHFHLGPILQDEITGIGGQDR
jgi:hypothetical protein